MRIKFHSLYKICTWFSSRIIFLDFRIIQDKFLEKSIFYCNIWCHIFLLLTLQFVFNCAKLLSILFPPLYPSFNMSSLSPAFTCLLVSFYFFKDKLQCTIHCQSKGIQNVCSSKTLACYWPTSNPLQHHTSHDQYRDQFST